MIGTIFVSLCSLALGFVFGAAWMRLRRKRFEFEALELSKDRWIAENAARLRRQVTDAVMDLRGRGDLPPVAAVRIICTHIGLRNSKGVQS